MKKILLSTAVVLGFTGLPMTAQTQAPLLEKESAPVVIRNIKSGNDADTRITKLAPGVSLSVKNGMKKLNFIGKEPKTIDFLRNKQILKSTTPEGYVLYESFEDWDGDDYTWTPEGWIVDMRGDVDRDESWTPGSQLPMMPPPSDGKYYYGIQFSMSQQDEWLISPYVTVGEGMDLSYWLYLSPVFLFNLNNVDWDTFEFIGEPEVSATLQIWAQEEGGEWVMLRDYFDEYKQYSLMELFDMDPDGMEKNEVPLTDFYGKKTRVAFRYVGTDGNTMFIDAIGIGFPALEGVRYSNPAETLYWGFERSPELSGLTAGIALYPVFSPITWENLCDANASFTWTYCDPVTGDFVTSDTRDELSVTYIPDYRSEASKKNNLFYPPTLRAEAENSTPGEYTAPYTYFQAGGKSEYSFSNGEEFNASLMPFDFHELGLAVTTVSDDEIGDSAIPVFGHNANTDKYWLNYSLNGEEEIEGDYNKLIGIANLYTPPVDMPLVINGITVFGYGKISDDAVLKASVYALDEDMSADPSTFTVMGSATISGSQILRQDAEKGYLCLPFDFDAPAVIRTSDEHPGYLIMLEGFNSDQVEYFAPLQSKIDDPNGRGSAFMMSEIDLSNHIERPPYISIKRVLYKENGEVYRPATSFAISLDAEYPWLTTDCEKIELSPVTPEVSVTLGSYYDGSDLTVSSPAGSSATVTGRYNECVLKVTLNDAAVMVDGEVVVEGPGVKITIPVTYSPSGITSISADNAAISALYDLTGAQVNKNNVKSGLYIVRFNDGTVRKVILK